MISGRRQRQLSVLRDAGLILFAAVVVLGLYFSGHPIPCLFHKVTGLLCPGCGMTRMLAALLAGDIREAFFFHPMGFLLLPVLAVIVCKKEYQFVQEGTKKFTETENAVLIVLCAALVLFAVIRNLPFYPSVI